MKHRDGCRRVFLRTDGAYLIIGGLGALGQETAMVVSKHAIKHLV